MFHIIGPLLTEVLLIIVDNFSVALAGDFSHWDQVIVPPEVWIICLSLYDFCFRFVCRIVGFAFLSNVGSTNNSSLDSCGSFFQSFFIAH